MQEEKWEFNSAPLPCKIIATIFIRDGLKLPWLHYWFPNAQNMCSKCVWSYTRNKLFVTEPDLKISTTSKSLNFSSKIWTEWRNARVFFLGCGCDTLASLKVDYRNYFGSKQGHACVWDVCGVGGGGCVEIRFLTLRRPDKSVETTCDLQHPKNTFSIDFVIQKDKVNFVFMGIALEEKKWKFVE